MEDRTTVFYRPSETKTSTGFGLPADLLEKSRRRIRIVGVLVLLAAGVDLAMMLIEFGIGLSRGRGLDDVTTIVPAVANTISVALSIALIAATRNRRLEDRTVLTFALVFVVAQCFVIAITNPVPIFIRTGTLPAITWVTPLIILFPLIVPCPPRHTLITAITGAAMRPLGIAILAATGRITAGGGDVLSAAFNPTLAVVFAYFGARVVYGLGMEVAEARRMGSYELERLIGSGGMGEVWVAHHRLLARPAAVKLIRPKLLSAGDDESNAQVGARFEREAQAIASMRSPHTIGLYDFGVASDGTFFYVMELLDGFDADSFVERFGPVAPSRAIHLLRQMCHSLAEAHEAGLIHRDIKPANVFVCRYGRDVDFVKVLDFGLVRRSSPGAADPGLTAQNVVTGTPAFMAPEQATNQDRCDARTDIYAVGCVAYWLLTGKLVFEGASALEVLTHHLRTQAVAPSSRTEMPIPEALDRVVLACLEKDPARRPQDATALSAMLASSVSERWGEDAARKWWAHHAPAPTHDA